MNTEAIIGSAGTGKSFLLRQRIEADPQHALLTASTGIAAVNLGEGVTTVHSALGFFDLRSLQEAAKYNKIRRKAIELAERGKKNLVIDEVSMFGAEHLQIVHEQFERAANEREDAGLPSCGLILCGDFLQLSPINDDRASKEPVKYAFEAPCWPAYSDNLTHLTKVWRQDNPAFLAALQLARAGRGVDGAIALKQCGVEFAKTEDEQFDGITLFPVNAQVDSYNERRLAALPGKEVEIPSERWGKEKGEWKNIPQALKLKDGALVMVLVNEPGTFRYVNGDLATFHVNQEKRMLTCTALGDDATIHGVEITYTIETKRGWKGTLPFTIRRNISFSDSRSLQTSQGHDFQAEYENSTWGQQLEYESYKSKRWIAIYLDYIAAHSMQGVPYWDPQENGLVIGEIRYMPLRLAYGSSYHKVQGLTLDKVQISLNHYWAGNPGMLYVALSRCRSVEGLRIIGDVQLLSRKIKMDTRVKRWV